MVLERKPTNQGIRFILGICIIAISIYAFYISLAKKNSPELFLIPETIQTREYPCKTAPIGDFTLCIPSDLAFSHDGAGLEVFSSQTRIRGTIQVVDELPQEKPWRESLHKPWIKQFIGDVDGMDTFVLMRRILEYRYNPTLMGVKAKLIPPWMKNNEQARIIIPEGRNALLFYTQTQFMGLIFSGQEIIILSFSGYMDEVLAASIMDSIEAI
jgi:hypothetical protein